MLKAILFDLDQTVVNSSDGFRAAESWLQREMFEFLNLPDWEPFIVVYRGFRGKGPADTPAQKCGQWREVCRHFGTEPGNDKILYWQDKYWALVDNGSFLFPETMEVLTKLKDRFRLGLITNASAPDGKPHRLDRFPQLKSLFDALVICDGRDMPPKPAPDGFRKLLSQLQLSPEEVIYVGDDPGTDVKGARAAGVVPVLLRHKAINWKRPVEVTGDLVKIDSLEPLLSLETTDTLSTARSKLREEGTLASPDAL